MIWLLFNNRNSSKITLHNCDSWSIRQTNHFTCMLRLPIKLFTILSKCVLDDFSPEFSMFYIAKWHFLSLPISLLLHLFKTFLVEYLLSHFIYDLQIVHLNEHTFTHTYIAHQKRNLFNIFHNDKLPFSARQIFLSYKLFI